MFTKRLNEIQQQIATPNKIYKEKVKKLEHSRCSEIQKKSKGFSVSLAGTN